MKQLLAVTILAIVAIVTTAQISFAQGSESDVVGVYFDYNATTAVLEVPKHVPFVVYVTLTNPTSAEVTGFEFGYTITGNDIGISVIRLTNSLPQGAIDLGNSSDLASGDYVVELAEPLPGEVSVILVQWQLVLLVNMEASIQLGPSSGSYLPGGLPAYNNGTSVVPMSFLESCIGAGLGAINYSCGLPEVMYSFGGIKSLYR